MCPPSSSLLRDAEIQGLGATAYVLELRHRYPSHATKSTTEECDAWRERTLQLEAELHAARTAATTEAIGAGSLISWLFLSNLFESISLEKSTLAFCRK